MSEKKEQVKPLAPASHRLDIEETAAAALPAEMEFMAPRHRTCIKCGGCSLAILLIIVMVILVLMLTVFHVKDPVLNINYVTIQGLDHDNYNRTDTIDPGLNMTMEAEFSVKNPNVASFKFSNMTTSVYYDGSMIGETTTLTSGEVIRARRTLRMTLPIKLRASEMLEIGGLKGDLSIGMLAISSYTRICGNVKISGGIERSLVVRMNCTMNVNARSKRIQDQNCWS